MLMLNTKSNTLTRLDLINVTVPGERPSLNSSLKTANVKFEVIIIGFLALRRLTSFLKAKLYWNRVDSILLAFEKIIFAPSRTLRLLPAEIKNPISVTAS